MVFQDLNSSQNFHAAHGREISEMISLKRFIGDELNKHSYSGVSCTFHFSCKTFDMNHHYISLIVHDYLNLFCVFRISQIPPLNFAVDFGCGDGKLPVSGAFARSVQHL